MNASPPLLHRVLQGGLNMQLYDVSLNGEVTGSVCVTKEGLYTRFRCQCKLPDTQIRRLILVCNGRETDLGICVPQEDHYAVNKKIQSRQIGEGEMAFRITSTQQKCDGRFVSILGNEPFSYISELEHMRLCVDNDRYGALLTNHPISQ